MTRALAWIAVAVMAVCAIYGLVHEHLFAQLLWSSDGFQRWLGFAVVYGAAAGLVTWFRPRWLGPLMAAFVLIYSVWWCARFFDAAAPMAVIFFLGSSFLVGRMAGPKTDGVTALLLGIAFWSFVISIVVVFPVNNRLLYTAALAIPYVLSWRRVASLRLDLNKFDMPRSQAAALALLLFVLMMHFLVALKPEVSSDGLAMHLAIPMAVAHDARWTFDYHRYTWALTPMGGDWAFTAVYLLGGEVAAKLFNFTMLLAIVVMIYQTSRSWLPPSASYLAAALFASTPIVQLVTGSLFVENIWAAMILGASLAVCRGELVWAGILMGAALSTKVGTTAYLLPAALVAVWNLTRSGSWRRQWKSVIVATVLFAVFAAPPYLNSLGRTGNPMFPFFNDVFKSPQFETSPTAVQDFRFHKTLTWKSLYDATFRSNQYFEGQNGSIGFQYFVFLIPLLLLLPKRKSPRALLALGMGGAALTFATLPNLRYLYPALPLLSIGFAWLISELPVLVVGVLAVMTLNIWFLPASGWYNKEFALFSRAQMEEFVNRARPELKLIDYLNRTAPGEPVAFFGGGAIAGLNARAYTDQWRTYEFWKSLIHAGSAEEIAKMFQQLGIHHVISPVLLETNFANVRYFMQQWTIPSGVTSGREALYDVIAAPVAPPHQRVAAGPGSYDDLALEIEYTGTWLHDRQFSQPSLGSLTYSSQAGDSLRLLFRGSAVTYVYTKALNRGIADVVIDGKNMARINQYSARTQWQARSVFSNLIPGEHTIEVQVLGQKDPRSSDTFVDLDRFVISP